MPVEAGRAQVGQERGPLGQGQGPAISYVSVGHGTQPVRRFFTPADLDAFCDHQRRREVSPEGTMRVRWPKELRPPKVYDFTALRASRKKDDPAKAPGR